MEPSWDHRLISPCEKIVYIAQYKVMSQSMEAFLRERNWRAITTEETQASQTKLVIMRNPYDRLVSALSQAQIESGFDQDTIDLIFSKKMLLIDGHITGFIGNLRRWEEQDLDNLLQNLTILPLNNYFPTMFNLFFKQFDYDYNHSDIPRLNASSYKKTYLPEDMLNGLLELELDIKLWNIIDTTYRWYRLDPDYKIHIKHVLKNTTTLDSIIDDNDSLRFVRNILKAIKN